MVEQEEKAETGGKVGCHWLYEKNWADFEVVINVMTGYKITFRDMKWSEEML